MARPSKPVAVIKAEGKGHRTKAELKARETAEKALLSGQQLYERPEVKHNDIAHKEFIRVKKLMGAIGKNDALYSSGINTYCQLYAEISQLDGDKTRLRTLIDKLEKIVDDLENENLIEADQLIEIAKQITRLNSAQLSISTAVDKKRNMMLSIDKENVMTISAALRSIPKTPDKEENPLLKALTEDDDDD